MLRRVPLKPGKGFKAKPRRHEPAVERSERPMALSPATRKGVYAGETSPAKPKDNPLRSEEYRRLVAQLPCICGCGRQLTQAAHPNTGKGMALKTDDRRCFPLAPPCHQAFDQGAMFPKQERREWEDRWGAITRATIIAAGKWPAKLPRWTEE